jgi:PAS domain S-box-containing protein
MGIRPDELTLLVGQDLVGQDNESLAQRLVDSVVDYAIYMLDLDGTVKSWNVGAQRLTGYSREEIIGSNVRVFYTDDDIRAGEPLRSLETALAAGRFETEGWRVRKDGTRLWASAVIDTVRNSAGDAVGFAKITRDITQRSSLKAGSTRSIRPCKRALLRRRPLPQPSVSS